MHPKQDLIEAKIKFWHGLQIGQRVQNSYLRHKVGTMVAVIVREAGSNVFGQCVVEWNDRTVSIEHPEHLSGLPMPGAKAA